MGAWGTGLYQDDTTDDIREEYLNYLRMGLTNEEATNRVLEENDWWEEDEEEGPLLWFALADTQWKYGRLMDKVKKQAIKYIEEGTDLERWEEDKRLYTKRKEVLEKLKERLNSPMSKEKKVGKLKMLRSPWKEGDVLLYQILDEDLKAHKYYKKYAILKVFKIVKSKIGTLPIEDYYHETSVFALYNWVGDRKIENTCLKNLKPIVIEEDDMPPYGIYRLYETEFDIDFRKELKMLNVEVLLNDKDETYLKNPPKRNVPMISIHSVYTLGYTIKNALEEAENYGELYKDFHRGKEETETWGAGLYQDYTTDEIRDKYLNYLRIGLTNEEATNRVLEENNWWEKDEEKGAIVWFALADTQWEFGILMDKVKRQAMKYIEEGRDLGRWEEDKKLYKKRKEVLEELKERLNSPMPVEKKSYKYGSYKCPWNIGDIFAVRLNDGEYKGKYIVLIKVGEDECYPYHICPIVCVFNKIFNELPQIETLKEIRYLPQFFRPASYKGDYKNIRNQCQLYITENTKKYISDFIYIGKIDEYIKPKQESNTYFCKIEDFINIQIDSYNIWKGIEY